MAFKTIRIISHNSDVDYSHLVGQKNLNVLQDKGKTVVIEDPISLKPIEVMIQDCIITKHIKV